MALSFGGLQSNMGPFKPVSLKGNARINAVPMFVKHLPLTIGGVAGEDVIFGRVVSVDPNDRRHFVMGIPTGNVVKGIAMFDPAISMLDPGQQKEGENYYFAGRFMTATTFGILDILEWDLTQSAPFEGATVWCRKDNGLLAFNDGTALGADYVKLNAFVYETLDPNGAKIFFNLPLVAPGAEETLDTTATPVADPAAGAVDEGTQVTLTCDTPNAIILYTLDGTEPTFSSQRSDGTPITISAAVTIKAIAIAEGKNKSATLTAAYTIN